MSEDVIETPVELGAARSPGPSVQSMLDTDTRAVPESLRDHSYELQGTADVSKVRYTSRTFAELEQRYLWRETWQMACMEVDLDKVGDHVVYDVAGESLIVVRTSDGEIRAYHNACLHRGTKLRVDSGRTASFRCPFHGWKWSLEGELIELPAQWDFPHIMDHPDSHLPEATVATWQGFVFVNLSDSPEPFETYAAKLIEHFDRDFDMTDRYRTLWVTKEVPANWKIVMEAFAEGYHVIATHPQILEFTADENSEYSIWPESPNTTRFVNGFGAQSPHLDELSDQQVVDAYLQFASGARRGDVAASTVKVPEGATSRQVVADVFRSGLEQAYGADVSDKSDAEMLDAVLYHLFPAFAPWAGIGQSLVYRWRPGSTPETSFMDVIRLAPLPSDGTIPEPAAQEILSLEQSWKESAAMGGLADVFEQDMDNLPRVQAGMHSTGKTGVSFSVYMEARIRMHHRMIDEFITRGLERNGQPVATLDPYRVAPG